MRSQHRRCQLASSNADCRHTRQRVIVLRDFNREQRCVDCGALVFKLPPANPSDAELLSEAVRRSLAPPPRSAA
jgi:hypothetical protein